MHTSLDSLGRELDRLALIHNSPVLYAMGGSSSDGRSRSEDWDDLATGKQSVGELPFRKPTGQKANDPLKDQETVKLSGMERRLRKIALEVGVAPGLALSMAKVESKFDHKAVSPRGAIGVLQVMPQMAWEAYEVPAEKLFDPEVNIRIGLTFMKSLLQRFDHNVDLSLAAYNAGPTKVVEAGYQIPPIRQTQEYVKRVRQAMNDYGPLYWFD
jgi:soluble lytic murein transglycosylase-like protein